MRVWPIAADRVTALSRILPKSCGGNYGIDGGSQAGSSTSPNVRLPGRHALYRLRGGSVLQVALSRCGYANLHTAFARNGFERS
jgi:hypothetical protein